MDTAAHPLTEALDSLCDQVIAWHTEDGPGVYYRGRRHHTAGDFGRPCEAIAGEIGGDR